MTTAWLDTNVVVRFVTGEPAALAQRAKRILARAEAGQLTLRLAPIVVAEAVWVLRSVYGHERAVIARALTSLLRANGISADERDTLLEALDMMVKRNVGFPDAYIAVSARQASEAVCTFDSDFKRLSVEVLSG